MWTCYNLFIFPLSLTIFFETPKRQRNAFILWKWHDTTRVKNAFFVSTPLEPNEVVLIEIRSALPRSDSHSLWISNSVFALVWIYQPLRMCHKVNVIRSLTGLYSNLSFSYVKEPILPYYSSIAGGRTIGFILFLTLCEMKIASSRIWTCFSVSISITGTSLRM